MELGPQFHWSPSENRVDILRNGLQLYSPGLATVWDSATGEDMQASWPYICVAPDPKEAWFLSGDMHWGREQDEWDLWLVTLVDGDDVQIRSDFGPRVKEVRVLNSIPADRIWLVAQRTPQCAITTPARRAKE